MKQLSLRLCALFALIFFCCFGCTDHEPLVKTYSSVTTGIVVPQNDGTHRFEMSFNSLGNVPIREYGVVYSKATDANFHTTPTVSDTKVLFNQPVSVGSKQMAKDVGGSLPSFVVRAYAIHDDDTIVYGETIKYD